MRGWGCRGKKNEELPGKSREVLEREKNETD